MRADCLLNTSAIDKQEKIAYVRSALHDQVKLTYDIVVIRGGQQLAGPFGCRLGLLLTVRDRDRGSGDRPLALFILLGHCGDNLVGRGLIVLGKEHGLLVCAMFLCGLGRRLHIGALLCG